MKDTVKNYYDLAKPGMIYGNLVTTSAGFLFGTAVAAVPFEPGLFFSVVIGTVFVIGSACVFNNYLDRDIDARMPRTKERAIVRGTVSGRDALTYGTILAVLGFSILLLRTNIVTFLLEIVGFIFYVVLYTFSKRKSVHGALIGSISGSVPILAGYSSAVGGLGMTGMVMTGRFDLAALILFLILVLWQMPHFYAIALYRSDEYRAASIPLLPIVKGVRRTKIEMLVYTILFSAAIVSLGLLGYTGGFYLFVMSLIALGWVALCIRGFFIRSGNKSGEGDQAELGRWARGMFLYSLMVIMVFSVMVSFG